MSSIVGYAFQAAIECPECIRRRFRLPFLPVMSTEDTLDRYAAKHGIDRDHADTNDFPWPVFSTDESNGYEHCDSCRDCIGHDMRECAGPVHNAWYADGNDISGSPYAEQDADTYRAWSPNSDLHAEWTRRKRGDRWTNWRMSPGGDSRFTPDSAGYWATN